MKPPKFDATYESDAMHRLGQGRQPHRDSKLRAANSIHRRPRFIGARRRSLRFRSGTIYLASRNGAAQFDGFLTPIFDVTLPKYYGAEYDLDLDRALRLKALAEELQQCRQLRTSVVLHCDHGRSRSVICLGVYLMLNAPLREGRYDDRFALGALTAQFLVADEESIAHFHAPGLRVSDALLAFRDLVAPT